LINIKPICAHCKKNPGPDPRNPVLAHGFYDGDTKQFSCWDCRNTHYEKKSITEHAHKYTEFPVQIERESA
jgi:hypothetical protein